jgi:hypothetical protein
MSIEPSNVVKHINHLHTIALEHAQQTHPSDACLPPHVVDAMSKDTAMNLLHGQLPRITNQSDIQVGK